MKETLTEKAIMLPLKAIVLPTALVTMTTLKITNKIYEILRGKKDFTYHKPYQCKLK